MEKLAETDHQVHDLIRSRWSPRAFSDRKVDDADLRSLFEAARWAASCANEQPWCFIVARRQDGPAFERLLSCLVEGNQSWAKGAAVLVLSVASTTFARGGKRNRHAWYDVGQAAAQLSLEATARGLMVHQMAGFSVERARESFDIPEGFEPVTAMALGHPADPQTLPEDLRRREQAPRERKPQSEFVFGAEWGEQL